MDSQLLPISAITAELLEEVALRQIDDDEHHTQEKPPEWWIVLREEAKKALGAETNGFQSLVATVAEQRGVDPRLAGGTVLKLLTIGWKMAGLYLEKELERSASA